MVAAACGDAAPPAPGTRGGGVERPGSGDASAGGSRADGGSDAGARDDRAFGFDEFAVDPAPRAGADETGGDGGVTPPPAGWRCRAELGSDAICDCGCGAPDRACAIQGCSAPGCALPSCEACWDEAGQPRDCGAPGAWLCERARRGDGVCDCGCGALDPDCAQGAGCYLYGCNVEGCELCHGPSGSAPCGPPAPFECGAAARDDGQCD
jgi:hypothetical protein